MTDKVDMKALIDAAARGEPGAVERLRNRAGGNFENMPREDIPPFARDHPVYDPPNAELPKSLEEHRADREYDVRVVDEFVEKVLDTNWLAPGAAMMLFVVMCTEYQAAFSMFGNGLRHKMIQLFRFWEGAHPWVKTNILYRLRYRLHDDHHLMFCKASALKARRFDAQQAELKRLQEESRGNGEEEEEA